MCRYGCPEVLITDQGREFVNEVSQELYTITQTEHRITSAYHPQVCVHAVCSGVYICQLYLFFSLDQRIDREIQPDSVKMFGQNHR